jgi:hypothetical protein
LFGISSIQLRYQRVNIGIRERLATMNFCFNSNVRVGNSMYHVQTEDRGPSHPFLDTVVYLSGRVIYKRSTPYEQFVAGLEPKAREQNLHERLSQQHRDVIAELEADTLPIHAKEIAQPLEENAAENESLELRLLNPTSWFASGNVILEIELCVKNSRVPVGNADVQAILEFEKQRFPCAEVRTDHEGRALLKFPMLPNASDGAALVVRATDGSRYGELRFRLKAKPHEPTPAPASR